MATYTAIGSVSQGDAVCLVGFDGVTYPSHPILVSRATAANLAVSRTVHGVARSSGTVTNGNPVDVNVAGEVAEDAVTSLTSSAGWTGESWVIATDATNVITTNQCKLIVVPSPDGSEHVVGTCDENGNLAIQPRSSRDTSALATYNPKGYGCPWDGIHDDAPGWAAMMAAIPVGEAVRIDVPAGLGYFSTAPHVTRYVHLSGRGGGAVAPTSGWRVAPGECGLICDGVSTTSDGGSAVWSTIEHIDLISTLLLNAGPTGPHLGGDANVFYNPTRADSTFYEKGNCVVAFGAVNSGKFFRVTSSGGTSGVGGDPTDGPGGRTFATALNGDTFVDGGITWTCEAFPADWAASTVYSVGDRAFGLLGDNRYLFEVTAITGDAKSGTVMPVDFSAPLFPYAGHPNTIADNHVTWTLKMVAGVWMKAAVIFRHSCVVGFMGPMVYAHGDGLVQGNDASFTRVEHINTTHCGEGVCFRGADCNGGTSEKINAVNLGWKRPRSWTAMGIGPWDRTVPDSGYPCVFGGSTIWDASEGGNTHIAHYSQDGGNPYVTNDVAQAVFLACRSENGSAAVIGALASWYGATANLIFPPLGGGVVIDRVSGRGLTETMFSGTPFVKVGISQDFNANARCAFPLWTAYSSDPNRGDQNYTGYWYESINGSAVGSGWMAMGRGPYAAGFARPIFGVSLRAARNTGVGDGPGVGLYRIYDGFFGGRDVASAPYTGYGCVTEPDPMLTSKTIRYGMRVVGDSFVIPGLAAAAGTWTRAVCTAAGLRAPRWNALGGYRGELDGNPYDLEADQVEPTTQPLVMSDGAGQVWRFISGPGTGAEPLWPGAPVVGDTFTDADGNVWQYKGPTAIFEPAAFVDDRLAHLIPQRDQVWGDTPGTDPSGKAAFAKTKSWRRAVSTTTAAANQVLFAIAIEDQTTNEIDVVISGKQSTALVGATAKLTASYVREGVNTTVRLPGTDDSPTPKLSAALAGTTFALAVSGDTVNVTVSPSAALDMRWNVTTTNVEMASGLSAPTITSLSYTLGDPAGGGVTLTITGTGFVSGAGLGVTIGGAAATSVAFVSSTQITCLPGAHAAAAGLAVVVTNPDAQTGTLAAAYEYYSPAQEALTGYWKKGDYASGIWTRSASAGTSGASGRDFTGANPPAASAGEPVFDGITNFVDTTTTSSFFSAPAGSIFVIFNASSAVATAGADYLDPGLSIDTSAIGPNLTFTTSGVQAWLYDGARQDVPFIACGTGAFHMAQLKFDGTNVYGAVDGGAWSSVAAGDMSGATGNMRIGAPYGVFSHFAGTVRCVGYTDTVLSDATFAKIKAWAQSKGWM